MSDFETQATEPRFRLVRYGTGIIVATAMLVSEQALMLNCYRLENTSSENRTLSLCASRQTCDSLVDRSFPPHNHTENPGGEGSNSTVRSSASGQVTNTSVQMVSSDPLLGYSLPNGLRFYRDINS